MTLTYRSTVGRRLTVTEGDGNITHLAANIVDVRDSGASTSDSVANQTLAIQAAIDGLSAGEELHINEAYSITGLTITNKTDIRITGKGSLTLSGATSAAFIFKLVGTIDNLVIDGLELIGEANAAYSQQAIGNASGQTISNVWFVRNKIYNCNSGISLNAETTGTYTKAHVLFNSIKDSSGTAPGQGYGIHMNSATHSLIFGNVVENASRTSILHAATANANNVIAHNIIKSHRSSAADVSAAPAMQILWSSGVLVSGNLFDSCSDGCLLIHQDTATQLSCSHIDVIGNVFRNRQNLVSDVYIGENSPPTSYTTSKVRLKDNSFTSAYAQTSSGADITIYNGSDIEVKGNTFHRSGVSGTNVFIIWGGDAAISATADFTNCSAVGNRFVAEGATLTDTRGITITGDVDTGTSYHRIDNREFTNITSPVYHNSTPTNPNLMVLTEHRSYVVGTGAQVGAGTTDGKARTNAAVRIMYSRKTAAAASSDDLWDLTSVSTAAGAYRKVLLCLQDAATPLLVIGETASTQAIAQLPMLPHTSWAALGVVEIGQSYSGGALGAMTFYDVTGIYEP